MILSSCVARLHDHLLVFFRLFPRVTSGDSAPPTLPSALQVSKIAVSLCGIICFLLTTKKTTDSFYPQYLQVRDESPEHLSNHPQILFFHLCDAKEGYGQPKYAMPASPHFILLVMSDRAPVWSLSM